MFEDEGVQFLFSDGIHECWLNIRTLTDVDMHQKSNVKGNSVPARKFIT